MLSVTTAAYLYNCKQLLVAKFASIWLLDFQKHVMLCNLCLSPYQEWLVQWEAKPSQHYEHKQ